MGAKRRIPPYAYGLLALAVGVAVWRFRTEWENLWEAVERATGAPKR